VLYLRITGIYSSPRTSVRLDSPDTNLLIIGHPYSVRNIRPNSSIFIPIFFFRLRVRNGRRFTNYVGFVLTPRILAGPKKIYHLPIAYERSNLPDFTYRRRNNISEIRPFVHTVRDEPHSFFERDHSSSITIS